MLSTPLLIFMVMPTAQFCCTTISMLSNSLLLIITVTSLSFFLVMVPTTQFCCTTGTSRSQRITPSSLLLFCNGISSTSHGSASGMFHGCICLLPLLLLLCRTFTDGFHDGDVVFIVHCCPSPCRCCCHYSRCT
jgi:hypothetical protein